MRRRHLVGFAFFLVGACSSAQRGQLPAAGGFSGGTQPLALLPAPGGLCGGDGTHKDCANPAGCAGSGASSSGGGLNSGSAGAAGAGYGSGYGGSGAGSYGGGSSYDAGSSYGGSGAGSWGGSAGAAGAGAAPAYDAGPVVDAGGCKLDPEAGITSCDGGTEAGAAGSATEGGAAPPPASTSNATSSTPPRSTQASACQSLDSSKPYTLYESADDSNSTASPVIARALIRAGRHVPPDIVRPWEFLNYYTFNFEPAQPGQVRIIPQLSSCPVNGQLSLQVALQSEHRSPAQRAPLNITFVLDTSGSMGGGNQTGQQPIELERDAVLAIAGQLRTNDVVSMVTWSTTQNNILVGHKVTGPDDPAIVSAAQGLTAGGGTDLHAGLVRGYELAKQSYAANRINRVVLISDGIANVGVTDADLIGKYADDEEGQAGIYLAGIGVGQGVNDTLMNKVTNVGRGAYVYLDSAAEAQKMLGRRFLSVIDLAARSVRLEVTLPWYLGVAKFYGEQMSKNPAKVRPQHLGPNDAMLFFQVLKACDPSLLHGDDHIRLRATWQVPFTREKRDAVIYTTLNALAGDDANLTKAAAITGYAEAVGLAGQAPDPASSIKLLKNALDNVKAAKNATTDPDLLEIAGLLQSYIKVFGG